MQLMHTVNAYGTIGESEQLNILIVHDVLDFHRLERKLFRAHFLSVLALAAALWRRNILLCDCVQHSRLRQRHRLQWVAERLGSRCGFTGLELEPQGRWIRRMIACCRKKQFLWHELIWESR